VNGLLDSLEAALKKKKWVEDSKCIRNTTVPVLKITCSKQYANKKVDISIQETRHNGIHCVELVRDYLAVYPPLRPLVLAFKQFLYTLNLNDTYSVCVPFFTSDHVGWSQFIWTNLDDYLLIPDKGTGNFSPIRGSF